MILVTGASGLLGSHLLLSLLKKGYQVKALATAESSISKVLTAFTAYNDEDEKLYAQINWYYGSITDTEFIYDLLADVDYVYHCAAIVSFSPHDIEKMNDTNTRGTEVLVNMCLLRKVKKFCHVSSVAALGKQVLMNLLQKKPISLIARRIQIMAYLNITLKGRFGVLPKRV